MTPAPTNPAHEAPLEGAAVARHRPETLLQRGGARLLRDHGRLQHHREVGRDTDLRFVALLVLFAIIEPALAGLRFKLLLDPVERLPLSKHIAYYYCAYYFNLVLPSSLGGDGVRFVFLSRHGIAKSQSATALIAERVLGIFSLIFVCGVSALFADLPTDAERTVFVAVAVAAAGVAGLWVASRIAGRLAIKSEIVSKIAGALTELGRPTPRLAAAFGTSVIYQAVGVLLTVMAACAFRIEVSALEVFAFVPLIWFLTMVPLSLGGLGVREAGFVYLFGTVGVAEGASLLLSLGTYAGLVAAGAVGGVALAVPGAAPSSSGGRATDRFDELNSPAFSAYPRGWCVGANAGATAHVSVAVRSQVNLARRALGLAAGSLEPPQRVRSLSRRFRALTSRPKNIT